MRLPTASSYLPQYRSGDWFVAKSPDKATLDKADTSQLAKASESWEQDTMYYRIFEGSDEALTTTWLSLATYHCFTFSDFFTDQAPIDGELNAITDDEFLTCVTEDPNLGNPKRVRR